MDIKDLTGWGIYSDNYVYEYNGKYIHTTKYTDKCGFSHWRFYASIHRNVKNEGCLWRDKNSRGRKIETRFYLTREEVISAGKLDIDSK